MKKCAVLRADMIYLYYIVLIYEKTMNNKKGEKTRKGEKEKRKKEKEKRETRKKGNKEKGKKGEGNVSVIFFALGYF